MPSRESHTKGEEEAPASSCTACRVVGTGVSLLASGYLLGAVHLPDKPPTGAHKTVMLGFAGAFAVLGLTRAFIR